LEAVAVQSGARVPQRLPLEVPGALRLDLLYAFLVLSEELSFTRAASRLFLSQPGLSRRIRLLEGLLGQALAVRTTREVRLTPAGTALVPHAKAVLLAAESAAAAVRSERPALRPLPTAGS
jgi:DNA-binding transcriptional LysR family regulator